MNTRTRIIKTMLFMFLIAPESWIPYDGGWSLQVAGVMRQLHWAAFRAPYTFAYEWGIVKTMELAKAKSIKERQGPPLRII